MKAAMAENLATSDSNPNEDFNLAYSKWSDGRWGMIITGSLSVPLHIQQIIILSITGNVQVDVNHLGNFKDPAVPTDYDANCSTLWKAYAEASQKHGTPTIVQIAHPGRQSLRGAGRRGLFAPTIAPSAIPLSIGTNFLDSVITSLAFPKPREMDQKDIHNVIHLFVDSARFIAESGFSGIELHAAHGYLLGEFNLA
jgi:2,4-dienoyl-CoA reductase-like NADH-dependent reductase (Old Yellow Enzyme family)